MQDDGLSEQERQLEAGLKNLQPAAALDRDALMFAAGRRAERRKLWGWRAAAGGLAAGWLVTLGVMGQLTAHVPPNHLTPAPQVAAMEKSGPRPASTLFAAKTEAARIADNSLSPSTGLFAYFGGAAATSPQSSDGALALRNRVLRYGVEMLPAPTSRPTNTGNPGKTMPTYGNMLQILQRGDQL